MQCIPVLRTSAAEHIQRQFNKAVVSIWQQGGIQHRLGLAVSGGVDSMALASLCGQFAETARSAPAFTAFVVDHGLREGSGGEVIGVAAALRALNIESEILTLDWGAYSDPSTLNNFETVARTLRYQALGRACHRLGMRSLLVGHHADDQAETVLLRLVGQYMGAGLQGIRSQARIPECQGIYGVDSSGQPRASVDKAANGIQIEGGGVTLFRPLLSFAKQQLVELCQQTGIEWFEDHTNSNRTLTRRNTIRYLHNAGCLPVALRRERLVTLAEKLQTRTESAELRAQKVLEQMNVQVDLQQGMTTCAYGPELHREIQRGRMFKTVLLRKLVKLVTPRREVVLQELRTTADILFRKDATGVRQQIAGVFIERSQQDMTTRLVLHREPPYSRWAMENVIQLHVPSPSADGESGPAWSGWYLWDNRYWIRVGRQGSTNGNNGKQVSMRFLTNQDVGQIRKSLVATCLTGFESALKSARGMLRLTLPALITNTSDGVEVVEALPSLGWTRTGWKPWTGTIDPAHDATTTPWVWDIRYRSIETARSGPSA